MIDQKTVGIKCSGGSLVRKKGQKKIEILTYSYTFFFSIQKEQSRGGQLVPRVDLLVFAYIAYIYIYIQYCVYFLIQFHLLFPFGVSEVTDGDGGFEKSVLVRLSESQSVEGLISSLTIE